MEALSSGVKCCFRGGNSLTDAWDDVELIVDLLVHGCGDDAHLGKGVGYRVNAHLSHEQRQQEDLILLDIMILKPKDGNKAPIPTLQEITAPDSLPKFQPTVYMVTAWTL